MKNIQAITLGRHALLMVTASRKFDSHILKAKAGRVFYIARDIVVMVGLNNYPKVSGVIILVASFVNYTIGRIHPVNFDHNIKVTSRVLT